jgi:hypothetical protein
MTWMQMALLSTTLLVVFVYFGGPKFSLKLVRNVAGGLGVFAGLSWQGALGLADSGIVIKIGFLAAGYALALGLLRLRGVES